MAAVKDSVMARLLIDWVYYPPVGHAVEAFRLATEFRHAAPHLEIGVLLNARAPLELADCVPAVDACWGIELGMPFDRLTEAPDLSHVPRDWDFLVRGHVGPSGWAALDEVRAVTRRWIRSAHPEGGPMAPFLPRREPRALHLELPATARAFAARWLGAERTRWISVVPAAGSFLKAPPLEVWARLLGGIARRHPEMGFVLIGSTDTSRSSTQGFDREDARRLEGLVPVVRDAFDLGLLNQLALAERCALHVSPHTGISFAIQAVGVPWLVLSGHRWPEYLLSDVPIWSIPPTCPLYPCHGRQLRECQDLESRNARVLCMRGEALADRVGEALDAADRLLGGEIPFETSARRHLRLLRPRLGLPEDVDDLYGWGVPEAPASPPRFPDGGTVERS